MVHVHLRIPGDVAVAHTASGARVLRAARVAHALPRVVPTPLQSKIRKQHPSSVPAARKVFNKDGYERH